MISITALSRTLHALIPLLALPAALHGEPSGSSINPVESVKNWIAEATNPDLAALPSSWANIPLNRPEAEEVASLLWDTSRQSLAMQRAEKNIEELQANLKARYHTLRQTVITEELFDIISGFEALGGAQGPMAKAKKTTT